MSIKKQQIIGLSISIPGVVLAVIGIMTGNPIIFFSGAGLTVLGGLIINPLSIFEIFR